MTQTLTNLETNSPKEQLTIIKTLEKQMNDAAANLEFELAAVLRDQINELKNNS